MAKAKNKYDYDIYSSKLKIAHEFWVCCVDFSCFICYIVDGNKKIIYIENGHGIENTKFDYVQNKVKTTIESCIQQHSIDNLTRFYVIYLGNIFSKDPLTLSFEEQMYLYP